MPLYEHVFLARQEVSSQQVEALIKEFSDVIAQGGGSVGKTEYWGLKGLAYKIKKSRKAHYALMNIDAPPAAVAEMERRMGLSPDILRFLTLRVEAHETEPSVQMRKSDERREGERGGFRGERGGFRGGERGGFRGEREAGAPRTGEREGGSTFRARPSGGGFRGPREGGDRDAGGAARPPRPSREPQSGSED